MRTDRFQPQGPVDGGGGGPVRLELSRVVPLGAVIALASGLVTWSFTAGSSYSTQGAINTANADRMARIEAAESKDMAALRSDMTERMARTESAVTMRFDAWDKRGDARMAMLTQKFDTSDKHDEALADALNALNLRLTRLEAAREFTNTNGPSAAPPAAGGKR